MTGISTYFSNYLKGMKNDWSLHLLILTVYLSSAVLVGIVYREINTASTPGHIFIMQAVFIGIACFYYLISTFYINRKSVLGSLDSKDTDSKPSNKRNLDKDARDEFIALLGHEIRNPLASLLSSVEILKFTGKSDSERERVLQSMDDRIRAMGRLVNDIQDISSITLNRMALRRESVRARDAIRRAAESVQANMSKNKYRFSATLPDKNIFIEADSVRMEQIVASLLNNAAKYTPSGGFIDLSCSFERELSDHNLGRLVIRVRDTGLGLTEEEQENIFEPFAKISPGQPLTNDSGLILMLCKNLTEMHDGTIDVQSDGPGRGTEFIVRIPAIIRSIGPADKVMSAAPELSQSKDEHVDATKILIVDDNMDAARGLSKLLEFHGHNVCVVHCGSDVLQTAPVMKPDVIVIDIGLPDMDGYEVAKRLRKSGEISTLIALSGFGQEDSGREAREAGFDYYLTKPVSVEEVLNILKKITRNSPLRELRSKTDPAKDKKKRKFI